MNSFRKTNKIDHSYSDLIRGFGTATYDIDILGSGNTMDGESVRQVWTERRNCNNYTIMAADLKSPNTKHISLWKDECDSRYSLLSQRFHFTEEVRVPIPWFVIINWTKNNDDPKLDHAKGPPMLYLIPGNYIAWKRLKTYCNGEIDPWQTPWEHANFINGLKKDPDNISRELKKMSNTHHEYDLGEMDIDLESFSQDFPRQRAMLKGVL
jgi:hypothetical protein